MHLQKKTLLTDRGRLHVHRRSGRHEVGKGHRFRQKKKITCASLKQGATGREEIPQGGGVAEGHEGLVLAFFFSESNGLGEGQECADAKGGASSLGSIFAMVSEMNVLWAWRRRVLVMNC